MQVATSVKSLNTRIHTYTQPVDATRNFSQESDTRKHTHVYKYSQTFLFDNVKINIIKEDVFSENNISRTIKASRGTRKNQNYAFNAGALADIHYS